MNRNWKTPAAVVGLALVPVVAWSALAPAPFSTGPTPINALPFTINDPGTYCLTGNLFAGTGVTGIDVQAQDVVIDLGGFVLQGAGLSEGSGIRSVFRNVTVKNGAVAGWPGYGIELGQEATVSDVQVRTEGVGGIRVDSRSLVERSTVRTVQGNGIVTMGFSSTVDGCRVVVSGNEPTAGIQVSNSGTVLNSKVFGGLFGIAGAAFTRVEGCHVRNFRLVGIGLTQNGIARQCTATGFAEGVEAGILSTGNSIIEGCSIGGSVDVGIDCSERSQILHCEVAGTRKSGIVAADGSRVVDCIVDGANTTGAADAAGILAGRNVRIEGCSVSETTGHGIRFEQAHGRVERCDVESSTSDGIVVQGNVHVIANRAFANDGVGIRVLGDRCVLKENVVDGNLDRGIVVEGTLNLLERNRSYHNKGDDYVVPFGNPYGEIERPFSQMNGLDPQANYETPPGF